MFMSDRRLAVVHNVSFYTSFSDDIKAQLFTTISYRFFMVMFLICTAILCYFFIQSYISGFSRDENLPFVRIYLQQRS
jgi:hypothetical protein